LLLIAIIIGMRSPTCDTSPILYLLLINQIELLPRLYQTIIIPDVESILGYAMLPLSYTLINTKS